MGTICETEQITKHFSLRFMLTVTLIALIMAVTMPILAISHYVSARSVLVLSENMTVEVSNGIIDKIATVLNSAEKVNGVVEMMITQRTLDPNDGILIV